MLRTKTKRLIFASLLFFLFLSFAPAFAALVTCGNEGQPACTFDDLIGPDSLLTKVIDFVLYDIVPPLAIFGVVWAAIIMMTSGGDPGKFKQGKNAMLAIAVGLIIIYLSWFIVKSFIQFLGGKEDWTLKFFK